MSSVCITSCVRDTRLPPRPTYVNLYKWPPESNDADFVTSDSRRSGGQPPRPRVVDCVSCRQMYLRSYPFSREDDQVPDRSINCFGGGRKKKKKKKIKRVERRRRSKRRKVKEMSWLDLFRVFRRLLSYSATVDVVE